MLAPGDRVGVAVSGGADSVALLRLLLRLRDDLGITLAVVHFDHSLRGAESDGDAEFVAQFAHAHGLQLITAREDVGGQAQRQSRNLEDMARQLRYAFFEQVVADARATRIAVAHTADDQAETVLAHIIRGTGLTGLGGIHPAAGAVVRPLLATRRAQLGEYLGAIGQPWREDSTNRDTTRTRARIREQLVPMLARDFSPTVTEHLNELSRLAREEESFWDALVEDRFQAFVGQAGAEDGHALSIPVDALLRPLELRAAPTQNAKSAKSNNSQPLRVLTERLIRRLYEYVRGNRRELSAHHVEQVIHIASGSRSGQRAELPGGIIVQRNFQDLTFALAPTPARAATQAPALAPTPGPQPNPESAARSHGNSAAAAAGTNVYEYVVTLPLASATTVSIPELGKRFRLKLIDWPIAESDTKRDADAIDADLLRPPLILRNWRPGDAYRPHGRRQEQKLRRMFVTGRVRRGDRNIWPVLESAGRVVWARGMPPADDYRARGSTRLGVVIEEQSLETLPPVE